MYPTSPLARVFVSTSGWTMTARTIGTSNGSAAPRRMRRTTVVSLGPRTLPRASSTVRPVSEAPSIASITSPASSPAFSAGEPPSGATTASRQSAPRVVQADVAPARSTVPIVAPMPSNWPGDPLQGRLELVGRHVQRVGIAERADHALDRALDQRLAVDVAAGVAVGDRGVRVPERLERLGVARRGAGRQRRLPAEREPGEEQHRPGEHGDEGDGTEQDARPIRRRIRRRAARLAGSVEAASG